MCTYTAVRGLRGSSDGLCVVLPARHPVHFFLLNGTASPEVDTLYIHDEIKTHSSRGACVHTQLCVACAGVPVVYAWCYQHATLSTFACRAGPFSCRLTLAKLEKK